MATQTDSAVIALENIAENVSDVTEQTVETVVAAAATAIEQAEQRAEIAEAVAETIVESARESAIVEQAQEGQEELWIRLNAVAADLENQSSQISSLQSSLTEIQSLLLTMKPAEHPEPEANSLLTPPVSAELEAALAAPLSLEVDLSAAENPAPVLRKRRKIL